MKFSDKVREKLKNFLEINEPQGVSVTVNQLFDHEGEVFRDKLWQRGEAYELHQFYSGMSDQLSRRYFWAGKPSKGMNIRKIHTGLPSLIVKVLTNVCTDDFYGIEMSERQEEWETIADENNFTSLVKKCVRDVLVQGDGAFKFSFDENLSKLPIIEFFPAERVDYEYTRGRLTTVVFKTEKFFNGKKYILKEHYSKSEITFSLEDGDGKEVNINDFSELKNLNSIKNNSDFLPAVQVIFDESTKFEGRGESIFSGKHDSFDSLDEAWSQWMLALRKGQIKHYIPEKLIPKNINTGEYIGANDFDNDYIQIESDDAEGAKNQIHSTQGEIQHEALLSTYVTALDLCLQGIISPSTLGIDVKKLDNGEAQREKEKATIYTRNKVVNVLSVVIPQIVITALKFKDGVAKKDQTEYPKVTANFGGYANPSFESQVETIGKASTNLIMSTEACVEELYGDSKDENWKMAEVRRIKSEKGILETDEPSAGTDGLRI